MTAEWPTVTPAATPPRFAGPRPHLRAFREEVLAKQGGEAVFIDVRSPEEYRGELLAPPHLPQEQAHTSVVALRRSVLETPTCLHHWLIEAPQGPTSKGHCKKCGTEREFLNSLSDDLWRDDSDYWRGDDLGRGYGPWDGLGSARHVIDEEEMAEDA